MNEHHDLLEEEFPEEKNRFQHMVIIVILSLLIGFLAGFISHDHLVHFTSDHLDWKSWYPQ